MANLTITPANVGVGGQARIRIVRVGESVTQGQPGYYSISDNLFYQADANASQAAANASCMFLTAAATNGYAVALFEGDYNPGATVGVGTTYAVSATKGAVCPIGDLTTGDWVTIIGTASTSTNIPVSFNAGAQKP